MKTDNLHNNTVSCVPRWLSPVRREPGNRKNCTKPASSWGFFPAGVQISPSAYKIPAEFYTKGIFLKFTK